MGRNMLRNEKARQLVHSAILAMAAVGLVGCDKARGVAAVKELCAKDGGLKILGTADVPGYLTDFHDYFCTGCIELLGGRAFDYADAHVTDAGRALSKYYRYSLGQVGDANCETWQNVPEAGRRLRELGVKEDECVVVVELSERPAGLALSQRWSTVSYGDVTVRLNEWLLRDETSATTLAQIRDYQFTSKLTAMLDMSGHGGNPDRTCMRPGEYVKAVATLKKQVPRSGNPDAR